jgi:predicted O-methyltransferase YrrM
MDNDSIIAMANDAPIIEGRHLWNSEMEVCTFVGSLVAMIQPKRALEIGVFQGETSLEIIKNMPADSYFAGIDIEDFRTHNWVGTQNRGCAFDFIQGSSTDTRTYSTFADKFDFIFVDSMHHWQHILPEWKIVEKWLAPGGVIAYHDTEHIEDVARLMDYISAYGYNIMKLRTPDNRGLTLITKA